MLPSPGALNSDTLMIQHPAGHLLVSVKTVKATIGDKLPRFEILGFVRTARYLFQGKLFVPADIQDDMAGFEKELSHEEAIAGKAQDEQALDHPVSIEKSAKGRVRSHKSPRRLHTRFSR